jgi:hypothetical protein
MTENRLACKELISEHIVRAVGREAIDHVRRTVAFKLIEAAGMGEREVNGLRTKVIQTLDDPYLDGHRLGSFDLEHIRGGGAIVLGEARVGA